MLCAQISPHTSVAVGVGLGEAVIVRVAVIVSVSVSVCVTVAITVSVSVSVIVVGFTIVTVEVCLTGLGFGGQNKPRIGHRIPRSPSAWSCTVQASTSSVTVLLPIVRELLETEMGDAHVPASRPISSKEHCFLASVGYRAG